MYGNLNVRSRQQELEHRFSHGALVKLAHMEHAKNRYDWQGSEVAYFGFDELTQFEESQFWYVALSRGRSMAGVRPYVRASTNPDADSWVAGLISWWIDEETGFPIMERSGVLRWFWRIDDRLEWFDSINEAKEAHPELTQYEDPIANEVIEVEPKSLTFIPSRLTDNPALLKTNPEYIGNLLALPLVERERLLGGNWKIRPEAGKIFNRAWFEIVDAVPATGVEVRYWDKAGTQDAGNWTAGARMKKTGNVYYIVDCISAQLEAGKREKLLKQTAELDGRSVEIWVEQEPGSGGKESAANTIKNLAGWIVYAEHPTGPKVARWGPLAAQAEAGNVKLLRGPWNKVFLDVLHGVDGGDKRDDEADAASGAFNKLANRASLMIGRA